MFRNFLSNVLISLDLLSEKSGFSKLAGAYVAKFQSRKQARHWMPADFVPSTSDNSSLLKKLFIHLHIYHPRYIEQAKRILRDFPDAGGILITSPSEQVLLEFESARGLSNLELLVVRNVGRNFGAIAQAFPKFAKFEFVLHLHSKASRYMSLKRSEEWSHTYWNFLAARENVIRLLSVMSSNSEITVAYPELTRVLPSSAYNWGNNEKIASTISSNLELKLPEGQIAFPAGGMFICRRDLLVKLISCLGVADFPTEPFPIDGTVSHALERLMGVYGLGKQPIHLVLTYQGLLTTDTSYTSHKGGWG